MEGYDPSKVTCIDGRKYVPIEDYISLRNEYLEYRSHVQAEQAKITERIKEVELRLCTMDGKVMEAQKRIGSLEDEDTSSRSTESVANSKLGLKGILETEDSKGRATWKPNPKLLEIVKSLEGLQLDIRNILQQSHHSSIT